MNVKIFKICQNDLVFEIKYKDILTFLNKYLTLINIYFF